MPKRIQMHRRKGGWRKDHPEAVIVARGQGRRFGNPFPVTRARSTHMGVTKDAWVVGTFDGPSMWIVESKSEALDVCIKAFAAWIEMPPQRTLMEQAKRELRGKDLACWCPLDQPCHADVLLEVANRPIRSVKEDL